ncbi:recombinase family protein [Actinokineospora sp. NPDC004072]
MAYRTNMLEESSRTGLRFAFYWRVSTEDNQDPITSRNWQHKLSMTVIGNHGTIVREYSDVGESRALPWKRRPGAAQLLKDLADPTRPFDAVVIGEPQRAFYGNQYGLIMPVFVHFGVQLWVPEVAGPIDPDSEAHDLVMSLFSGMSKGERTRIKHRIRAAMSAQAELEGRFLGGRPPYGYRLVDAGPHPNPAKAADGKRLHQLDLDPVAAPVVLRIFTEYDRGYGMFAIAERLTADGVLSPSAHDPARNPHRKVAAWSKSAVRVILTNPRYLGNQVWGKQHRKEVLIDVDDVALGHQTVQVWSPRSTWVTSREQAHPAIVGQELFARVQQRMSSRGPGSQGRVRTRPYHPYVLRGLIRCALCERLMQGNWVKGRPRYRCRFPSEYAGVQEIDHPLSVYLREDHVVPHLDGWLAQVFSPAKVAATLERIAEVQDGVEAELGPLRQRIAECDRKLTQHKRAIEAGVDPTIVNGWMQDIVTDRSRLQHELAVKQRAARRPLSTQQIKKLADSVGGLTAALEAAAPS